MLTITVNAPTGELEQLLASFPDAERAGLERVATALQQIALRQVGRIYARSIPRSKTGRALWNRSGDLMAAVQAAPVWEGDSAVELQANTPYAGRRHGMGVEWTPRKPALGIIRTNPFFTETEEVVLPQVGDLFVDGWNEVMEN